MSGISDAELVHWEWRAKEIKAASPGSVLKLIGSHRTLRAENERLRAELKVEQERYEGVSEDLWQMTRVALQNPTALDDFIRLNYPSPYRYFTEEAPAPSITGGSDD